MFPDPAGIVQSLGASSGSIVIDLCAGDGWFTLPIAKLARKVFAVDIDPAIVGVGRTRLSEAGIANVGYIEGDAFDLPGLVPAPVDLVFMANCLHGVPDRPRLARIVAGMLRPEGLFSILNWHQTPREETPVLGEPRGPRTELRLSPDRTRDSVEAGGMRLVKHVEIPPYHCGEILRPPGPIKTGL